MDKKLVKKHNSEFHLSTVVTLKFNDGHQKQSINQSIKPKLLWKLSVSLNGGDVIINQYKVLNISLTVSEKKSTSTVFAMAMWTNSFLHRLAGFFTSH